MRLAVTMASILVLGLTAWIAFVFLLQRTVMFPRPPLPAARAADGRGDVEILRIGEQGGVEAWYLGPTGASGPGPVLIFAHGNGELIDYWVDAFDEARGSGLGVLLVEYPGYGRSAGRPTEESIARTMVSAFDAIRDRPDVDPERIVGWGRSLGGGAVSALAAARPLAALVLESTFTSVRPLVRRYGLIGPLVRDPFDNLSVVEDFEGPVLVIHGERDTIIPASHGKQLARGASRSELVLKNCGHNDCPHPWPEVRALLAVEGLLSAVPAEDSDHSSGDPDSSSGVGN
jgi:fermentation-respiration switch protein FrsA (DUF1100 family)